jgi:2-polyprenyl-3-methyl-5-hydroxy-6-metoxy-1,4-benzoquinol methylase
VARDAWHRERLEPMFHRLEHGLVREHVARYRFAAEFARGRVLDAGCGTGYGSLMLAAAPGVVEVFGVDRDARAVERARRYYRGARVEFTRGDLTTGALNAFGCFDTIVCLEVLEHLPDPAGLVAHLDQRLAPGGRLILSTPLGKGREVPSSQPFHFFQLRRDEFERLLAPRFRVRLFGQKGELIESWRPGGRYFLMVAICRSRWEDLQGESVAWSATSA